MIYTLSDKKAVDLSSIEAITESKSEWGQPGNNGHTNSAGTYFGFYIHTKYNPMPIAVYLCYDTDTNRMTINKMRDDLIDAWKAFKSRQ
jgi:hypothetical protein